MICGKKCYEDRRKVKKALRMLMRKKETNRKENAYYFCDGCDSWHITSRGKKYVRDWRRHLNKLKNENPNHRMC